MLLILPIVTLPISNEADLELITNVYLKHYGLMVLTIRCYSTELSYEDVIHDAMVKLIGKIETLKSMEDKSRLTYVVYTVRSVTINTLRKRNLQYRKEYTGDFLETMLHIAANESESPELMLEAKERAQQAKSVFFQLPERDRDLLYFKYYLNTPSKEIARFIQMKSDQINVYIQRVKRKAIDLIHKEEGKAHGD